MNPAIEAALEVSEFLSTRGMRPILIGGLAVQIWGETRLTTDADFTLPFPDHGTQGVVELVTGEFSSRVQDPFEMASRIRMILVSASNGTDVDLSLALPGYEDDLFARAVDFELIEGRNVLVCSPEDLIIHKAVAGRPQDV